MTPHTVEPPGHAEAGYRLVGAAALAQPGAVAAIAQRGGAALKRWFDAANQGGAGGLVAPKGPVPGNVASWLRLAMGIVGVPASWLGPLEVIAMHESGGNPHAINNWDSNAQRGDPSRGLMQTIGSTFRAHALPGHGDIWNPVDNAIAAIRYIQGRYRDISRVPGIASMARGGPYKGYAEGGITRALREGAAPRPLMLPRLTSQRAFGPDRGELRGPVPKRYERGIVGAGRNLLADFSSATFAARPEVVAGPGAGEGKALRFAEGGLRAEVGAAGGAQSDRALRLARVAPPALVRRGVERSGVAEPRERAIAMQHVATERAARLFARDRVERRDRPARLAHPPAVRVDALRRVDLDRSVASQDAVGHGSSLSPRRFALGGTVEAALAPRAAAEGHRPRDTAEGRGGADLTARPGVERFDTRLMLARQVPTRLRGRQGIDAPGVVLDPRKTQRAGARAALPVGPVEEIVRGYAVSLSPRRFSEGVRHAEGGIVGRKIDTRPVGDPRADVVGPRAGRGAPWRPVEPTAPRGLVRPTDDLRHERREPRLPLDAVDLVPRFAHAPTLGPRRFAEGGLRHGPERQRDEPTTYARRAPLGIHLSPPTTARNAAQAMPSDSRRAAVRWPAVQARIPAVEAHDLHARIVEPRRSTSTAVTTTAGFAPDLARAGRWAFWPTPRPSEPLRATEALRARGPGPAVPNLRDVKAIRVDRVEHFDAGGLLRPGVTVAVNRTGRAEPVLAAPIQTYPLHPVGGSTTTRNLTVELKVERVISGDVTPEKAVAMMKKEIKSFGESILSGLGS